MPADSALENLVNINLELNLSFIILSNTWQTGKFLTAWIGYSLPTFRIIKKPNVFNFKAHLDGYAIPWTVLVHEKVKNLYEKHLPN